MLLNWTRVGVAALCLAFALPVYAQPAPLALPAASVPRVVRVDGQFVPANGLPPAAVETVTLGIYAAAADGAPLFEETQDVRVDAQGRYALLLGATTAGLPASVLSGEARWLGMRVARPGEVEQARVPLTSVPYALRASDADTLGGLPPSAFLRAAGKDGAAGADGSDPSTARTVSPSVSTGTANFIGKFANSIDLTDSVLFDNAGRIGLGTTTPLDFLHSRFTNTDGTQTGLAVQNLSGSPNSYSGMLFYDQNGALGQFQGFNNSTHEYRINNIASGGTINFMVGSTSRFLVRNDGDIDQPGNVRKAGTLFLHSLGPSNTAVGLQALSNITSGGSNTAVGNAALRLNSVTPSNVAVGASALGSFQSLTGGDGFNVAVGALSMNSLGTGFSNVAVGHFTLATQTSGTFNTALGYTALGAAIGSTNTAVGAFALHDVSGGGNIALGTSAGSALTASANNIDIGHVGLAGESGKIRIGTPGSQNGAFIAGIRGVTTGLFDAVAVVIDSSGQLGTVNSSRRYKEDIQDMGSASSGLMRLRPVTYRYTQAYADGSKPIDYGLIAEEVDEVYPDLVAHLQNGEVETVQYHKINAMLLNEVQKQHREITDLKARLEALERLLVSDKK